ncbi:MAG: hypothetical protein ABI880_05450, partial [Acidobacteriota bacterium]
ALGTLAAMGRALSRALGPALTALGPDTVHALAWPEAVALVLTGALVGAAAGLLATWRWNPQGPVAR